jgi:DNA-binding NarL/FixJ family response regulator
MDFSLRAQPSKVRVLALDDDEKVWRGRIRETLVARGISCDIVTNLSQFNTALQTSQYDVASIDCVIGAADVQDESLRLLRESDPDIGKIVFSAMVGDPRIQREAKHWGADRVVEKQAFGDDGDYVEAVLDAARLGLVRRVLTRIRPSGARREMFAGSWPCELSDKHERRIYAEALEALKSSFLKGEEDSDLMNLLKRRGVLREFDSLHYISLPFHAKLAEMLSYVRVTPEQLSQILEVDTVTAVRLLAGDEQCPLDEKAQQNAYWLASILGFILRLADDEPDLMPGFWTATSLYARSRNVPPWDSEGLRDHLMKKGALGLKNALLWIRSYEGE